VKIARLACGAAGAIWNDMHRTEKRFVYILRSDADPARHYVGITDDVDHRLKWHNTGPCGYTTSYRPWSIVVSLEFPDEARARRFERYLKTGSGRAFAKRHFAASGEQ
jgi:predicted GIY-YIG superfamily endonuclease